MEVLKWDDQRMSVGVELFDKQHKVLLNIINKLASSIEKNSQKKDITNIVNELINYAKEHFLAEESILEKYNFSDLVSHKNEHAKFLNQFVDIKTQLLENKEHGRKTIIEIAQEVFLFIVDWFLEHVTQSDRKYMNLLKDIGIK